MIDFDVTGEPLSTPELQIAVQEIKSARKQLVKYSCISDVLHAFVFIALYFSGSLGGLAILTAVGISTLVAVAMALVRDKGALTTGLFFATVISVITAGAIYATLTTYCTSALPGTSMASLLGASIVIIGSTLGRQVKRVLIALEETKSIVDDQVAVQELADLCRAHETLSTYRERAVMNLRPHLTYGELKAMREWAARQQS